MSIFWRIIALFLFFLPVISYADSYSPSYGVGYQMGANSVYPSGQAACNAAGSGLVYNAYACQNSSGQNVYSIHTYDGYFVGGSPTCPAGGSYNSATQQCDVSACTGGLALHPTTHVCTVPPICKIAETFNASTWSCVAPTCPSPQFNDAITGACISPPPPVCKSAETVNTVLNVCVAPTCFSPQVNDPITSACVTPPDPQAAAASCPPYQFKNSLGDCTYGDCPVGSYDSQPAVPGAQCSAIPGPVPDTVVCGPKQVKSVINGSSVCVNLVNADQTHYDYQVAASSSEQSSAQYAVAAAAATAAQNNSTAAAAAASTASTTAANNQTAAVAAQQAADVAYAAAAAQPSNTALQDQYAAAAAAASAASAQAASSASAASAANTQALNAVAAAVAAETTAANARAAAQNAQSQAKTAYDNDLLAQATKTAQSSSGLLDHENAKSAFGSSGCSSPPSCSGDPIQCTVLYQTWHNGCLLDTSNLSSSTVTGSDLTSALGTTSVSAAALVDLSSSTAFNTEGYGLSSSSCPAPVTTQVFLGSSFTIDFSPFCSLAQVVGGLVMITSSFISLRMVAG